MIDPTGPKNVANSGAQTTDSETVGDLAVAPVAERCALSLLADESREVRRAAAEHLCLTARKFSQVPAEVISQIFLEPDPRIASSLVSFLAAANDPEGVAAPVCARLLSDERPGVALDAATALGDIAAKSPAPLVPMTMLAQSAVSTNDLRIRAFGRVGELEVAVKNDTVGLVQRCLEVSERAQIKDLKETCWFTEEALTDAKLDKIVAGLCSTGSKLRKLALRIIGAHADSLQPAQRAQIWAGLAFMMDTFEAESSAIQHEFLSAVRLSEMPAALAPMVESFVCPEHSDVSMARDFSAVYVARHQRPFAGLDKMCEMLWSDSASLSGGAASNLLLLAKVDDVPRDLAWTAVQHALEAYMERASDSWPVRKEFLRAFYYFDCMHAEVVGFCEKAIGRFKSPQEQYAIARLLGVVPWDADQQEVLGRVADLLEELSQSPHDRVAEVARKLLG